MTLACSVTYNISVDTNDKSKKGGTKEVTEIEILMTTIGELVYTEMDEVDKIEYAKDKLSAFTIVMLNGKRYMLELKPVG